MVMSGAGRRCAAPSSAAFPAPAPRGCSFEQGSQLMATMYCALCARPVEATRQIGPLTVLFAVLTAGLSLLAVPFYAKRCSICKSTAVLPMAPDGASVNGATAAARLADLERRLSLVEQELEAANAELASLREERDFYKELLGDPRVREQRRLSGE